jgi:hypothetical protein
MRTEPGMAAATNNGEAEMSIVGDGGVEVVNGENDMVDAFQHI